MSVFEEIRSRFPVGDAQWERYTACFTRVEVPAKTILLREGEFAKKMFLIERGCLRAAYNKEGKDITFQFFFEHHMVSSLESFRKGIPSPITIETLEPSVLWWISKADADRIIEEIKSIPALQELLMNAVFERTFDYMKHFFSFLRDTPTQRYLNLLQESPGIVRRVPQHYIASYLGITTVHLSRIKGKIARNA